MEIEIKLKHIPLIVLAIYTIAYIVLASRTAPLGEDEGTFLSLGEQYAKGNVELFTKDGFPTTFVEFFPSLLGFLFIIFGPSLAIAKILSAIFSILTLVVVYLIGFKISKDEKNRGTTLSIVGLTAVFIMLSISYFTQFTLIAYTETAITFFSALTIYLMITLDSTKKAIMTGILLGLSYYVKQTGLLFPVFLFFYGIYKYVFEKDKKYMKLTLIAVIISALMYIPWIAKNFYAWSFPYFELLNPLFTERYPRPTWTREIATIISINPDYFSTFGTLSLILLFIGASYYILTRNKNFVAPLLILITFFTAFYLRLIFKIGGFTSVEPRFLIVMAPQIAIIGALFISKLFDEYKKIGMLLMVSIIAVSIFYNTIAALDTASSVRYTQDYVDALTWIKQNTDKDAIVFTAYGGSVRIFAERYTIWTIKEFPDIMTSASSNSTYDILKHYNITAILIWRNIVAQNYVVPESNLVGAFTPHFINNVQNDKEHFNVTFSNANNLVIELL
jgi:hypothetical protein